MDRKQLKDLKNTFPPTWVGEFLNQSLWGRVTDCYIIHLFGLLAGSWLFKLWEACEYVVASCKRVNWLPNLWASITGHPSEVVGGMCHFWRQIAVELWKNKRSCPKVKWFHTQLFRFMPNLQISNRQFLISPNGMVSVTCLSESNISYSTHISGPVVPENYISRWKCQLTLNNRH